MEKIKCDSCGVGFSSWDLDTIRSSVEARTYGLDDSRLGYYHLCAPCKRRLLKREVYK